MQYPTVTLFDPGVGGAPTTLNPHVVPNLDTYDHSIVNEGGFESLEVSFKVSTRAAARAYLQRLMCHVEATSPRGRTVWEGAVQQVAIVSPRGQKTTRSLSEMANLIVVRYKATNGQQAAAPSVSDAASIARYGTKARLINFSTTTAAAAANRAAVVLRQIAHPPTTQTTESGSGSDDGGAWTVTLTCRGWWDTLGHLLTSTSSTAPVATHTQALTLLAAYNAINPFFGLSAANVVATGVTDTSLIEDDSTYLEAICTKLASGTSALERVVYGCYEQREITIRPWAQATPTTIHYVQRDGDPHIRDPYGSIVPIWDVRPDRMVSLPDLDAAAPSSTDPMQGVGRMYIRRVRVQITRSSQRITLEPEDANALEELLTRPAGAGVSGVSARQAAIERTVHRQAQTRFSRTNGTIDLGGGSITTGGGSIDTGGGSISNPGGGDITYPPGSGATGVTGSGTTGALTKWSNGGAGVLTNAVAGTDYVAPGSLSESIDDRVAALLVAGTGISLSYNDAGNALTIATAGLNETIDDRVAALLVAGTGISLSYNDAGNALTISNTGGTVGGTGTAGRIPQWATGGADIENSTLIKSGAGLLTLSAAGAATLTIDSSIRLNGAGASAGQVLEWNGTAYAPATLAPADVAAAPDNAKYIVQQPSSGLSAEQALSALATGLLKNTTTTGVLSIAVPGTDYAAASHAHAASDITSGVLSTARLGTGTANSTKYLAGDSTWQTLPSGVTGSAAATQVAYFSSAGAIAGNSALTFDVGAGDLFVSGVVNSNTHIKVLGTQVLGPRRTGWGGPTGTATRTTFATSTVTLSQLAERVKALIDDLLTHGAIGG